MLPQYVIILNIMKQQRGTKIQHFPLSLFPEKMKITNRKRWTRWTRGAAYWFFSIVNPVLKTYGGQKISKAIDMFFRLCPLCPPYTRQKSIFWTTVDKQKNRGAEGTGKINFQQADTGDKIVFQIAFTDADYSVFKQADTGDTNTKKNGLSRYRSVEFSLCIHGGQQQCCAYRCPVPRSKHTGDTNSLIRVRKNIYIISTHAYYREVFLYYWTSNNE